MRKWLAGKLFDLAVRLDWDSVSDRAKLVVLVEMNLEDALILSLGEPKKRGRPKGRKDSVGPKPEPEVKRKRGRPLGSKNKPKVQL
jgi:hypothetical protein